jgi:hypothetical protein
MTYYWIVLGQRSGSKCAQNKTRALTVLAPDRETAKRTAQIRWPGHQVICIEPLPKLFPAKILHMQRAIRRGDYSVDSDLLSARFFSKVAHDEAVESCQRLESDHRHAVAQVEDLGALNAADRIGEFSSALEDVYNDVSWHFAREEMPGGLYRSIAALGPHGDALRRLHWDHLTILTSLESTIAHLAAPMEEPLEERVRCAATTTAELVQQCQKHEIRERMLIESVLTC